ncbi:MAG TPA: hypothetical protein VN939_19455 [Chthoniobacterales bacterium]|nr:hypothetical protein [Chthoniobacterales bacterium]
MLYLIIVLTTFLWYSIYGYSFGGTRLLQIDFPGYVSRNQRARSISGTNPAGYKRSSEPDGRSFAVRDVELSTMTPRLERRPFNRPG